MSRTTEQATDNSPTPDWIGDLDAVVFDIGGVFTYPSPVAIQQWWDAAERGPLPSDELFRRAHHRGARAVTDGWTDFPDERLAPVWNLYDTAYLEALGLGPDTPPGLVRPSWDWPHEPNIAAFHRIAQLGLGLAVVSNNDGTAAQQMIDRGVTQVGDGPLPSVAAIIDSGQIGVAKPDPAIFDPALDALGVEPARVLYVGDTVHADVVGANNASLRVVQLDPFDDHGDFDHWRLADLGALADLLAARR